MSKNCWLSVELMSAISAQLQHSFLQINDGAGQDYQQVAHAGCEGDALGKN
jgi:hypothetical protein